MSTPWVTMPDSANKGAIYEALDARVTWIDQVLERSDLSEDIRIHWVSERVKARTAKRALLGVHL